MTSNTPAGFHVETHRKGSTGILDHGLQGGERHGLHVHLDCLGARCAATAAVDDQWPVHRISLCPCTQASVSPDGGETRTMCSTRSWTSRGTSQPMHCGTASRKEHVAAGLTCPDCPQEARCPTTAMLAHAYRLDLEASPYPSPPPPLPWHHLWTCCRHSR
jgi:hypothetical protein